MATRWGVGVNLPIPGWNFQAAFTRSRAGYKIQLDADASIRGSRTGELIARLHGGDGDVLLLFGPWQFDRGTGTEAGLPVDRGR